MIQEVRKIIRYVELVVWHGDKCQGMCLKNGDASPISLRFIYCIRTFSNYWDE